MEYSAHHFITLLLQFGCHESSGRPFARYNQRGESVRATW